jgi:hypothetical protein
MKVSAVSGTGGHGGLGRQMAVTREGSFDVGPGKELIVRCVSRGNDKAPRLALSIGGRNFSEIYTGSVEDASGSLYSSGGSSRDVAIVGRYESITQGKWLTSNFPVTAVTTTTTTIIIILGRFTNLPRSNVTTLPILFIINYTFNQTT